MTDLELKEHEYKQARFKELKQALADLYYDGYMDKCWGLDGDQADEKAEIKAEAFIRKYKLI